jgi:hypothetical protein
LRRMTHHETAGKRAIRPRCEAPPFCRRGTKLMSEKAPQATFSNELGPSNAVAIRCKERHFRPGLMAPGSVPKI